MDRNTRIRKTPQPTVEIGQFWKDKNGTVRRVVEPLDKWEIHFANIVTGYRTRCQRVYPGGPPSGRYTFVPKPEAPPDSVHIRFGNNGAFTTYCGEVAEDLITATRENLNWWRQKGHPLCGMCVKREADGVHVKLASMEAA